MPSHELPELLTPGETAKAIGVAEATLSVWRCTGRYALPFVKSGRKIRYRKTDVLAFIERRTRRPAAEVRP